MNTITNEMITYFNFFDFFKLPVDFEFQELENEIYTFIDQHNIKFPKKDFLNKDDLLQFYDTFSLDTQRNDSISVLTIPANVLSIPLPLPYQNLTSISVDSNNCVFQSIDGILYSKNLDQLIFIPPYYSSSKYELFSSITSICNSAFSSCRSLESILVESNNQHFCSIDGILFSKNQDRIVCFPPKHKFSSYCIPTSVTSIADSAFYGCNKINSITIPTSVTSMGSYAFYYCSNLPSIAIPTSVTSIGDYAFSRCSNLRSITVKKNNLNYVSINGILFTKNVKKLVCFPIRHDLNSYTIPTSVTSIGNSAFSRCSKLQSIAIPTSVTSIGDYAFYYCSNLQSIAIPTNVTSIGNSAFYYCSNLRSVSIPHIFTVQIFHIFHQNQLYKIGLLPIFLSDCDTVPNNFGILSNI